MERLINENGLDRWTKRVPATLCGIEFTCLLRKFLLKVLGSLSPNSFLISCFRTVCTASGMSLLSDTENRHRSYCSCVFSVPCEETTCAFTYLLWRISPNTGGARGDRGPMSKLSSPTAASKDTSLQTQTHIRSFKPWNIMNHYVQVHQYAHLSWGRSQRPADACLFYSLLSSWEESGT